MKIKLLLAIMLLIPMVACASGTTSPTQGSVTPLTQGGTGSATALGARASLGVRAYVDVTASPYNAVGDNSTDNCTRLQAAVDANPLGNILVPKDNGVGIYRTSCSLILTNASGKNFQGSLYSDGATIKFTTTGSSGDTNANMAKGIIAYPRTNGAGGDTSGWSSDSNHGILDGFIFDGPANGASVMLANSIDITIEHNYFGNARYGLLLESTINMFINKNTFYNHKNAGVGFIRSNNSSIYYSSGMWNDGYTLTNNGFNWGNVTGALAFIEDEGSFSERNRIIAGNHMQGADDKSGTQYGYLGRGVLPTFTSNWVENVKYPLRILSSNSNEGGSTTLLAGVTGYQPSGTFQVGYMVDTYCYGAIITGNYTHAATIAFQPDCNGQTIVLGGNLTDGTVTSDLKSSQGGKVLLDFGNSSSTGSWITDNSYGGFFDLTSLTDMIADKEKPTISSGFGTGAIVQAGTSSSFRVDVGTGGTASSGVIHFTKSAPNTWACFCTDTTNSSLTIAHCKSNATGVNSVTLTNYDTTMTPAAWAASDVLQVVCFGN